MYMYVEGQHKVYTAPASNTHLYRPGNTEQGGTVAGLSTDCEWAILDVVFWISVWKFESRGYQEKWCDLGPDSS